MVDVRTAHNVPTIKSKTTKAAYITGQVNHQEVQMLLDSGASCSVVSKRHIKVQEISPGQPIQLVNADRRDFTPMGTSRMKISLGKLSVNHTFIVVEQLSVPVILGCDFMSEQALILDLQGGVVYQSGFLENKLHLELPNTQSCNAIIIDDELPQALPSKSTNSSQLDMPSDVHPALEQVIDEYRMLFSRNPGQTHITQHIIDTGNAPPVKVPPRPIPFHLVDQVQQQLTDMAQEGIIRPSSSPWCAPAVYIPKSNGEIHICVDFVQLNRVTKKDSYPVPRANCPHQRLAG